MILYETPCVSGNNMVRMDVKVKLQTQKRILLMEPDRYQQNKLYYVIGMIFLVVSLYFFCVGTYLLPYIVFGVSYSIPDVVYDRINYVEMAYNFSTKHASWIVLAIIYFVSFLCASVTYFTSNEIDNEIYGVHTKSLAETEDKESKNNAETKESRALAFKIVVIIGLVFGMAKLLQWAISNGS